MSWRVCGTFGGGYRGVHSLLDTGVNYPLGTVGDTPPSFREYTPSYSRLVTHYRVRARSYIDGTLQEGTDEWGDWTTDPRVLLIAAGSSHDYRLVFHDDGSITADPVDPPGVRTVTIDMQAAGRGQSVQITIKDKYHDVITGGVADSFVIREPTILIPGAEFISFDYGDPGIGKTIGVHSTMLCLPAKD